MRTALSLISVLCIVVFLSGCGETVNGVGRDVKRVSKGVKTIFFRDSR